MSQMSFGLPPEKQASTILPMDAALDLPESNDADLRALRQIVEGTAGRVGEEFLKSLVQHLAAAVGSHYCFVTEFLGGTNVRTLAMWKKGQFETGEEWSVVGTPCEDVIKGNLCHHPRDVMLKFPQDRPLVEWGIQSYLGVPLLDSAGMNLGHLAVFDEQPMPAQARLLYIFRIFAARAAAELQRMRAEKQLRESESRFRDLYEEAPIAYVYEDLDTRFVSANRAAIRLLGLKPEEVKGTIGKSLVPTTPDAQRRLREAFESIGKGTDTSGIVLELRRKDNGQPIWVQFWSKPDPDGKHTRTMIVDITELFLVREEKARVEAQNRYLQDEIKQVHNFEEIIGASESLLKVLESVGKVAPTDASVLITGETGTGKELIARAVHSTSIRKDKPLIKVNCAALPPGLIESELFGHERGAFSGAINRHTGRFELAHGGTIFLDEIGELPMELQSKLLRVLQEREFERLGGTTTIKADVRVITATNRNLAVAVQEGKFRQDLFYRLNVFPVHLPPLRERSGDIELLVRFLIRKYGARVGRRIETVSSATIARLQSYSWPGNIRELENVLERALILGSGPELVVGAELFPEIVSRTTPKPSGTTEAPTNPLAINEVQRNHIYEVLTACNWVIEGPSGAAQVLDLHPNTLRSRMKKLAIIRPTTDRG